MEINSSTLRGLSSWTYDPETGATKQVPYSEYIDWLDGHDRDRIVAKTTVGDYAVSTVFLGLVADIKPPLLFETIVFHHSGNERMEHYPTADEAKARHQAIVEELRSMIRTRR